VFSAANAPETSTFRALRSPAARRLAAFAAFIAVGCVDYVTGADFPAALLYVPILLALAFIEPWPMCLAYSALAAGINLGADLLWDPSRVALVRPYWAAFTRLMVFVLTSGVVSLLVRERRRIQESERVLQEKAVELHDKNRRLEDTLREVMRLQEHLVARERQAAIGDAIFATAYEMERPLASASVYVEELNRRMERAHTLEDPQLVLDDIPPLLEKLHARIRSMDRILQEIRDLHKAGPQVAA
jgi:signal transduction histidine kinase